MTNSSNTLHLQLFSIDLHKTYVGQRWEIWLEESEDELHLLRDTDDKDKTICLKRYGGRERRLTVKYLPSIEQNRNETYENEIPTSCWNKTSNTYLPTPPLGQDMTQGQFLSEV